MKVPLNLQYALTRNCSRYRLKNLNSQIFSKDPANIFGRSTAKDVGLLRKRARYVETGEEGKLRLVTKSTRGRVVKRKGKKSQRSSRVTSVSQKDYASLKNIGGQACKYLLWKITRTQRALKRAAKIAAEGN